MFSGKSVLQLAAFFFFGTEFVSNSIQTLNLNWAFLCQWMWSIGQVFEGLGGSVLEETKIPDSLQGWAPHTNCAGKAIWPYVMGPQWKWSYFACPDVWEELSTLLALRLGETGIEIRLGVRAGVLSASEQRYLSLSLVLLWDTAGAARHAAPHGYRKHSASARSVQSSQQHCRSSCLLFYLVTLPILNFSYEVHQNRQHRNNCLLSDCPDCSDCTKVSASQCPCYLAFSCLGLSQEGVLCHVCINLFPWYLLLAWGIISIFFSPTSLPKTNQPRSGLPRSSLALALPCLLAGAAFVCGCTLCVGG